MKKVLLIIALSSLLISCQFSPFGYVEQKIMDDWSRILCKSGTCYATYVWRSGSIIKSDYDDINTLTDSLILERKNAGERLLKMLNQ